MSDNDLIARLRWKAGAYAKEAADRIEQLVATNEALIAERDALFRRATLAEEWRDHDKTRAEAAEAKLATAVEALEYYAAWSYDDAIARATLAEIKGESHE